MNTIKLLLSITLIANLTVGTKFEDEFAQAMKNSNNNKELKENLVSVLTEYFYITFPQTDSLRDILSTIIQMKAQKSSQLAFWEKHSHQSLEDFLDNLYKNNKDNGGSMSNQISPDDQDKFEYFIKVNFVKAFEAAIKSNGEMKNVNQFVKSWVEKTINDFIRRNKVDLVNTVVNQKSESLVTEAYRKALEHYRDYMQEPQAKLVSAVDKLIEVAEDKNCEEDSGSKASERIVYFVKALKKLTGSESERQIVSENGSAVPWNEYVRSLIAMLSNKIKNSQNADEGCKTWGLNLIKELLRLLPWEEARDIIKEQIKDIGTNSDGSSSYKKMLEIDFDNDFINFNGLDDDKTKLKIFDLISASPDVELTDYQVALLVEKYDKFFGFDPQAYKAKPFTDRVVDTFFFMSETDPELFGKLVDRSYDRRINRHDELEASRFGRNIDNILDEDPTDNANLMLKLVNLKTNLVDLDEDTEVGIRANEDQIADLVKNIESVPSEVELPELIRHMYVYNQPSRRIPHGYDNKKLIEEINDKDYDVSLLRNNWQQGYEVDEEPEVINIDSEVDPNEGELEKPEDDENSPGSIGEGEDKLKKSKYAIQEDNNEDPENEESDVEEDEEREGSLDEESDDVPNQLTEDDQNSMTEENERPVVPELPKNLNNFKNKNIVLELIGKIGPENVKKLEEVQEFSSYTIDKEYFSTDDSDVEVTIVYLDRVESDCYGKNGVFA